MTTSITIAPPRASIWSSKLLQAALAALALAALVGVFLMYTQPMFLLTLADQLWSCF